MINIEKIKNNIYNKRITVIGAGISGQGASNLANYIGAKVLLSTNKKQSDINLISKKIKVEFSHSNKCLDSDLAIISPGIDPNKSEIIKKIDNSNIPIISEIEFGSWFSKSPIISVTGSNGKSTVVKILNDIFKNKYEKVFLGGNIGKSFCMNVIKELETTKKSLIHILELSSFQLQKIVKFKPKLSCILNIQNDHLDRHGNFKNYFNDKMNIVKNLDEKSYIVYNQDDINLSKYFTNNKIATPYSIINKNNLFIDSNSIYSNKSKNLIVNQNETKLIGLHNLSNMLAAIQIAKLFKIKNNHIKQSLIDFKPLIHRMERIEINKNIEFINDSKATNLNSTKSALESFKNKIILILGGYTTDKIDNKSIKFLVKRKNIKKIVCYGEVGEKIIDIISIYKDCFYNKEFSKAVSIALKHAKPTYTVLLSPGFKSFDQFKNYEERGNKFKEIIYKHYE